MQADRGDGPVQIQEHLVVRPLAYPGRFPQPRGVRLPQPLPPRAAALTARAAA
jgi:hypothetical protein